MEKSKFSGVYVLTMKLAEKAFSVILVGTAPFTQF